MYKQYKPRRNHKWDVMPRSIYVLIFHEDHCFFVGRTAMPHLWDSFDYHYRERQTVTQNLFHKYKTIGQLPSMYFLESIVGRDCDAFQRCILWSRYFAVRHGYKLMVGPAMKELILCMDDDMKEEYRKICSIPFSSLCSKEQSLYPNFKQRR